MGASPQVVFRIKWHVKYVPACAHFYAFQNPTVHWPSNEGTKSEVKISILCCKYMLDGRPLMKMNCPKFFGKDKNWNLFPGIGILTVNDLITKLGKIVGESFPINYGNKCRKVKLFEKLTLLSANCTI